MSKQHLQIELYLASTCTVVHRWVHCANEFEVFHNYTDFGLIIY